MMHDDMYYDQRIGKAWDSLEAKKPLGAAEDGVASDGSGDPEAAPAVAVFREHRNNGGVHHHAALVVPRTSQLWHGLRHEPRLIRAACHVTVPAGRPDACLEAMLQYCAITTGAKHNVDKELYLSTDFGAAAIRWPSKTG